MNNNNLFKIAVLAISLLVNLTACDKNPEPESVPPEEKPSLIGEWYQDAIEKTSKAIYTIGYKDKGTFNVWHIDISKQGNYLFDYSGTYKLALDQKEIELSYVHPLFGNNTDNYEVTTLNKYNCTLFNALYSVSDEMFRIVDTINLNVGESKQIVINDPDFVPVSYQSVADNVATVDNYGNVKAIKRGFSFIKVKSSTEMVVVRVIVNDPNNVVDDFVLYMGGSVDETVYPFGNIYGEGYSNGEKLRLYYLFDNIEQEVRFFLDGNNDIYEVLLTLRDGADLDAIKQSFNMKYTLLASKDGSYLYKTEKDGREIDVFISESNRQLWYKYKEIVPEVKYDNLITMTIDQAVASLGHTLTSDEMTAGYCKVLLEDDFFDQVELIFDKTTKTINNVKLRLKDGLGRNDIEGYYKEHYYATGVDEYPYGNKDPWYSSDFIVYFSVKDGRTYVDYMRF